MTAERISHAMDRIERALARIETQAALASHPPASAEGADDGLAARHAALRHSVSNSISELDRLIGELEQ